MTQLLGTHTWNPSKASCQYCPGLPPLSLGSSQLCPKQKHAQELVLWPETSQNSHPETTTSGAFNPPSTPPLLQEKPFSQPHSRDNSEPVTKTARSLTASRVWFLLGFYFIPLSVYLNTLSHTMSHFFLLTTPRREEHSNFMGRKTEAKACPMPHLINPSYKM